MRIGHNNHLTIVADLYKSGNTASQHARVNRIVLFPLLWNLLRSWSSGLDLENYWFRIALLRGTVLHCRYNNSKVRILTDWKWLDERMPIVGMADLSNAASIVNDFFITSPFNREDLNHRVEGIVYVIISHASYRTIEHDWVINNIEYVAIALWFASYNLHTHTHIVYLFTYNELHILWARGN